MAKTDVANGEQQSTLARVKAVPQEIADFYSDVRTEMKKVTSPSRKEVQATTIVVIITVALFGVYFFVVDGVVGRSLDYAWKHLAAR